MPLHEPRVKPVLRPIEELLDPTVYRFVSPPPLTKRFRSTRTRISPNGDSIAVLLLLAREKYLFLDETIWLPYWKDGNWENETWLNVGLAERTQPKDYQRSSLNVPSGTREYQRKWREANKDKFREYQRKSRAKMREQRAVERELERKLQESTATNEFLEQLGLTPNRPPDFSTAEKKD